MLPALGVHSRQSSPDDPKVSVPSPKSLEFRCVQNGPPARRSEPDWQEQIFIATGIQIAVSFVGAAYYDQHLHTDLRVYRFRRPGAAETDLARATPKNRQVAAARRVAMCRRSVLALPSSEKAK